jgi:phosphate transport system protein
MITIEQIRETLLLMASIAARNLQLALKALIERNDELAKNVIKGDEDLDSLEVKIDDQIITFIATHSPVAIDCRLALVASKISSDLERIGDQAVTISRIALQLNEKPPLKSYFNIDKMAEITRKMYQEAIDSFISGNPRETLSVVREDKIVDRMNKELFGSLVKIMREDPDAIPLGLNLMLVSRAIERAADHAKNIAEEVYYLYRAKDIRHKTSLINVKKVIDETP